MRVKLNASEIRRSKQSATYLEDSYQEFKNGSKKVDVNEISKFNQNSGQDGNEELEKKVREAMMNSEVYFESFVE